MDVFTENGLANMPGPQFLGFYLIVCLVAIVAVHLYLSYENADDRPPPPAPSRPDAYEIAYLRDGLPGVIWVAVYALKRAGFMAINGKGQLARTGASGRPGDALEARVLQALGSGIAAKDLIHSAGLLDDVKLMMQPRRARLELQGLLIRDGARQRGVAIAALVAALLIALAGYKIAVALQHGRHNVGFLFIEAFAAALILFLSARFVLSKKASSRGKAYLEQFKSAYSGDGPAKLSSVPDYVALALVGAFGYEILAGGPDAALAQQVKSLSRGDGGSSCGSSSSSCSGGDSGGGGGGCGGCGGGD